MSDFSVGAQGFQHLRDRIDTNNNQRIEKSELVAAADQQYTSGGTRNDGNVTLGEAAALADNLNHYLDDPKLSESLASAALGSADADFSLGFEQKVNDLTHLSFNGKDAHYHVADQNVRFYNSAPDAPVLLDRPRGGTVNVSLEKGMSVEWPPERASFRHPNTGDVVEGYQIKLSTGDQILLPPGLSFELKSTGGLHGNQMVYTLDANGNADAENRGINGSGMIAKYSTTFMNRRQQI